MVSKSLRRSAFFSQPGKAKLLTFLASRTRLEMTIPESTSGAGAAEECPFSAFIEI